MEKETQRVSASRLWMRQVFSSWYTHTNERNHIQIHICDGEGEIAREMENRSCTDTSTHFIYFIWSIDANSYSHLIHLHNKRLLHSPILFWSFWLNSLLLRLRDGLWMCGYGFHLIFFIFSFRFSCVNTHADTESGHLVRLYSGSKSHAYVSGIFSTWSCNLICVWVCVWYCGRKFHDSKCVMLWYSGIAFNRCLGATQFSIIQIVYLLNGRRHILSFVIVKTPLTLIANE